MSKLLGFASIAVLFLASAKASALDGETSGAYVQKVERSNNPEFGYDYTVTVKITKKGAYTVAGGQSRGKGMIKGRFTGALYYGTTRITGDAGDQITVTIRRVRGVGGSGIIDTAGVYDFASDIVTEP